MKNLKPVLASAIILISLFSCGQAKETTVKSTSSVASAKKNFKQDVEKDSINIYLQGGIVSVITKEDHLFEEKYGVKYHDLGCIVPENKEYYEFYNHQVFMYLSLKFGNSWKNEFNPNAFGWNNTAKF